MGVKSFIKKSVAFVSALAMACSMVVMPAGASYAEETNDNLHLSKGITLQSDGNYKITLEAYSTGTDTTTTTEKAVPLDIVLVLDQSGSMDYDFTTGVSYNKILTAGSSRYSDANNNKDNLYVLVDETYYKVTVEQKDEWTWEGYKPVYTQKYTISYEKDGETIVIVNNQSNDYLDVDMYSKTITSTTTRLAALKSAVTNFVETVEQNAQGDPNVTGDEVDHRIAIVGFASKSGYGDNTEVLSVAGTNSGSVGVKYSTSGTSYTDATKNAFQDTRTDAGKTMLTKAIDALAANGATNTGLGMQMANDILTNDAKKDEAGRKKLVIMFTDGKPTTQTDFDTTVANTAISNSQTIKASGTKVYSIGIFDGADPSSLSSNENKFMNYVSSNYPTASNMTSPGTGANSGYYKAASNATELNSIFESISNSETTSGTTVTLTSESVLRDIVSDKFELPEGAEASSVSVYTADSKTVSADGKTITWDDKVEVQNPSVSKSGNQVDVSGFDYSQNYVTANHPGKKLIVEILVNGLVSGENMESNDTEQVKSGIYENSSATTAVKNFVSPTVTIPEYSYVLDYGKKVTLPNKDKSYSETTQINSTKAAPSKTTSIKKTYGTFALENSTITYQPEKINWDGFDSIFNFGKKTDNSYEWSKVNVIPATSVYYEDDFGSFTADKPNTDANVAIVWDGTWNVDTEKNSTESKLDADKQQSSTNDRYGWDSSYTDDNKYSDGSAHEAIASNTNVATAKFRFTGTGVDVYSRTNTKTGTVIAVLRKVNKSNNTTTNVKGITVDNKADSGDYYQIPTLFFENLEYGTYEVEITVTTAAGADRSTYYLDGIRVYNPLGISQNDPVSSSIVKDAYNQAGEYNAQFKTIRSLLKSASDFVAGQKNVNGVVFIDEMKDGNSGNVPDVSTYNELGPKNEVYLSPGNAIAFKINSNYNGKVFIGAKSISGSPTKMKMTYADKTTEKEISHASDMYYEIVPTDDNYVIVQNSGTKILSITKLRLTDILPSETMSVSSDEGLLAYASTFSSLRTVETDDSGLEEGTGNEDIEIDNPTTDEENKEESNTINSIWQKIINSINKWFDR